MNRPATPSPDRLPVIVAELDLADEKHCRLHDLIRRFHTGRWPLLRCLKMRQIDGYLVEVAQWCRTKQQAFCVVRWHSDGLGLSWNSYDSHYDAMEGWLSSANLAQHLRLKSPR